MTDARPINVEQFEAERAAGARELLRLDLSQTSLAYVIFAVQCAVQCHPTNPSSRAILRDFIQEARRVGQFTGETKRLIQQREERQL